MPWHISAKGSVVHRAKDITIKIIAAADANRIVRQYHYSGSVAYTSQLHFGVFLNNRCLGAMQYGSSIDRRKMLGLVHDTKWNEFLELNRMAFSDQLPRNSESRAIGYSLRFIKKQYPWIKWVVSFADGTQCGDGAIYRASGFHLIQIKKNNTILRWNGAIITDKTLNDTAWRIRGINSGYARRNGAIPLDGYQLKYIFFLDPSCKKNLTVPTIPFSRIIEAGAGMYRGRKKQCAASVEGGTAGDQPAGGGANPTAALHSERENQK